MVAAALARHPEVQQLVSVGAAHGPVGETGAAGEEVNADPGQDDGGGRDMELFRIGVWVCVQREKRQQVILSLYLKQELDLDPDLNSRYQ